MGRKPKDRKSLDTKRYITANELSVIIGNGITLTQVLRWPLLKDKLKLRDCRVLDSENNLYHNEMKPLIDKFDPEVKAYIKEKSEKPKIATK